MHNLIYRLQLEPLLVKDIVSYFQPVQSPLLENAVNK